MVSFYQLSDCAISGSGKSSEGMDIYGDGSLEAYSERVCRSMHVIPSGSKRSQRFAPLHMPKAGDPQSPSDV